MAKTPVNIRLDDDLLKRVKKLAKADHRTFTNMVEMMLLKYIDDKEKSK